MEDRDQIAALLELERARTLALIEHLSEAELHRAPAAFLSPLIWDLGHIANFEELWLLKKLDGREPIDPKLDALYDAFDNPRTERHECEMPSAKRTFGYMRRVRDDMLDLLQSVEANGSPLLAGGFVYNMVLQHELQHQETILQALNLGEFGEHPHARFSRPRSLEGFDDRARLEIPAGSFEMGTDDRTYAYDNERGAHEVQVEAFAIDRYPVTVRRYAEFVADGAYSRAELWSDEGWSWVQERSIERPLGWADDRGETMERFGHTVEADPLEPVQHVSFHEAQAFASWSKARLPTEAEWEKAARGSESDETANIDRLYWGPVSVALTDDGESSIQQSIGDVYEWTASPLSGYPGFEAFPYREYSEVFFGGDYRVLRGASWAVGQPMARKTYRNWDHPLRRQIFSGIRLAWDSEDR